MEALINFIKDWLDGKTLSASWIVTLTIALTGVGVAGYVTYQEYTNMQVNIDTLLEQAHEAVEAYDDAPINARVTENSGAIIRLQERVNNLDKGLDRSLSNVNPLSL